MSGNFWKFWSFGPRCAERAPRAPEHCLGTGSSHEALRGELWNWDFGCNFPYSELSMTSMFLLKRKRCDRLHLHLTSLCCFESLYFFHHCQFLVTGASFPLRTFPHNHGNFAITTHHEEKKHHVLPTTPQKIKPQKSIKISRPTVRLLPVEE